MSNFVNTVDSIGDEALTNSIIDRSIMEIRDNYATSIGDYAFSNCSALTTADFPEATRTGSFAFENCTNLTTVNLPLATGISGNMFQTCTNLTTVNLPLATGIGTYAFYECENLKTIDLPSVTSILNNAFENCSNLTALILRSKKMATLSSSSDYTSPFLNTPIESGTGYIYVPAALVDRYKAASNWSTYANKIRAIEDYPEICG